MPVPNDEGTIVWIFGWAIYIRIIVVIHEGSPRQVKEILAYGAGNPVINQDKF